MAAAHVTTAEPSSSTKPSAGASTASTADYVDYCPYTQTSKNYDLTRAPLGLSIFFGAMAVHSSTPLHEQKMLDVGCGTGTFLEAAEKKVGFVTGLDYNEGMLEQAKARLGDRVTVRQGSADALPFPDAEFDSRTMNQVLHHFPCQAGDWSFLQRALGEMARVLKPGGVVVINTSAPEQQRDAFWWLELFPRASSAVCNRFPAIDLLVDMMRTAGLIVDADSIIVPQSRTLMAEERYLHADILTLAKDPKYRNGDSSWANIENENELEEGIQKIEQMVQDNTAEAWLVGREALRKRTGQATFLVARKPA